MDDRITKPSRFEKGTINAANQKRIPQRKLHRVMLCILTRFQVLHAPKSWSKYFLRLRLATVLEPANNKKFEVNFQNFLCTLPIVQQPVNTDLL